MEYKFIPDHDVEEVNALGEYCFASAPGSNRVEELPPLLRQNVGLGGYDGEKLATQLLIYPFRINLFGKEFAMGGIGMVSTYPEYRKGGITKGLLQESLKVMRANKQLVSVLAPFSKAFYRRFGYEVFSEKTEYEIPMEEMRFRTKVEGKVVRFTPDDEEWIPKIKQFHEEVVRTRHGLMYRESFWWDRINGRQADAFYAASLDDEGKIQGYLRYEVEDHTFKVHDFNTVTVKAERVLWQYIASHASQVEKVEGTIPSAYAFAFHFKDPDFKQEQYFDKMIRIVDVEAFLKVYPFEKIQSPLYVTITDEHADWNNHTFEIGKDGTVSKKEAVEDEQVLTIDIGCFSAMMVGFKDLSWYRYNGYASVSDEALKDWKQAISAGTPVFHDDF